MWSNEKEMKKTTRKQANLKKLMNPNIILFIGNRKIISKGIQNCIEIGFTGEILVVHPKEESIKGYPCYDRIQNLPRVPDAAFIAVNKVQTISVVSELNKIGTSGAVCYAAGFAEAGGEGEILQNSLLEAANEMVLVGPNCYGIINYLDSVALWPDHYGTSSVDYGAAMISQSGNISMNLTMTERGLPMTHMISVGNQASLEIGDYIEALVDHPKVNAIGIYMEGLKDIKKFSHAAEKAHHAGIPIIILKSGKSEKGSKLTMSHTSSLAGSDQIYNAFFKRLNVLRVETLSELIETLKLFSITGDIKNKKLGILTCSGGESTIASDFAADHSFELPELTKEQTLNLNEQLTEFEHISNPLDYNTSIWGNEPELVRCFSTFMQDNFDLTILVHDYLILNKEENDPWQASINALIKAKKETNRPAVLISTFVEGIPMKTRKELIKNGITPLQGMSEAFTALEAQHNFNINQKLGSNSIGNLLLPDTEVNNVEYSSVLNEWEGKKILKEYGVDTPKGHLIKNVEELETIKGLKPPFVVKAISSEIAHKTEIGAVQLNVSDKKEAAKVIQEMKVNLISSNFSNENLQFLIEEMEEDGLLEMMIGIKRDPQFGLTIVIGAGGELVNFLNDSAIIMLPTTKTDIYNALQSLKIFELFQGFRGKAKVDIEAFIKSVKSIATFAVNNYDSILEMDVNPILILPEGEGAIAVDAFIHLTDKKAREII